MKNFCVIDIGTNAVKIKIFSNGQYYTLKNKHIARVGNNVSKDDIIRHVQDFIRAAKKIYNVKQNNIYILATEGVRSAPNGKEIQEELEQKTKRKIHLLDPRREARLSVLGGLNSIQLKNNPKQVLFIESGGGSTEISLLDMTQKPFKIVASESLPIGSRNGKETLNQAAKINRFCEMLRKKGGKFDSSLQVVINSVAVSRIIAQKAKAETYRPDLIAEQQDEIDINHFKASCLKILGQKKYDEDFVKSYFLKENTVDGFVGHVNVLHYILDKLQQEKDLELKDNISISTTLGGLKEGAAAEIEKKLAQEGAEVLKIKESEGNEVPDTKPLTAKDKEYTQSLRKYYKALAAKEDSEYTEEKSDTSFHATLNRKDGEKLHIHATDANNIGLSAQNKKGEKKIPEYEDFKNLVIFAKQQGQTISFGNIKSEEFKARLLIACLENDVALTHLPQINPEEIDKETSLRVKKIKFHKKAEIEKLKTENPAEKKQNIDLISYKKQEKLRA